MEFTHAEKLLASDTSNNVQEMKEMKDLKQQLDW